VALGDIVRTVVVPLFIFLVVLMIALKIGNQIWDSFKDLRKKAQDHKAEKQKEKTGNND